MSALMQQYNLSQDTRLRSMISAAIEQVAVSVRAEPANQPYPQAAPGVTMSANRQTKRQSLALAIQASGGLGYVDAFAKECANNSTIRAEPTYTAGDAIATDTGIVDADVIFVCASVFDVMSGVLVSEVP